MIHAIVSERVATETAAQEWVDLINPSEKCDRLQDMGLNRDLDILTEYAKSLEANAERTRKTRPEYIAKEFRTSIRQLNEYLTLMWGDWFVDVRSKEIIARGDIIC